MSSTMTQETQESYMSQIRALKETLKDTLTINFNLMEDNKTLTERVEDLENEHSERDKQIYNLIGENLILKGKLEKTISSKDWQNLILKGKLEKTISRKELQQKIWDMDEDDNIWDILCDEYGFEVGNGNTYSYSTK